MSGGGRGEAEMVPAGHTGERARGERGRDRLGEREREREIVLAASCMFELIINESQSRK